VHKPKKKEGSPNRYTQKDSSKSPILGPIETAAALGILGCLPSQTENVVKVQRDVPQSHRVFLSFLQVVGKRQPRAPRLRGSRGA
jgi:hypothetical protein